MIVSFNLETNQKIVRPISGQRKSLRNAINEILITKDNYRRQSE